MKVEIYVKDKFNGHQTYDVLPMKGDRLVFEDDAFKGYIVESREFKTSWAQNLAGERELVTRYKLHCRLDK